MNDLYVYRFNGGLNAHTLTNGWCCPIHRSLWQQAMVTYKLTPIQNNDVILCFCFPPLFPFHTHKSPAHSGVSHIHLFQHTDNPSFHFHCVCAHLFRL